MIKIVYFDTEAASDYLDIKNGGKYSTVREIVKNGMLNGEVGANAGINYIITTY